VRELAICITLGGPRLRNDLAGPTGRRLSGLIAEVSILLGAKAKTDPQAFELFNLSTTLPLAEQSQEAAGPQALADTSAEPNWLELAVRKNY